MDKVKLEYIYDRSVARLILENGKGNVLDSDLMFQLTAILDQFKYENGLKLITFEGAGEHFSFGASIEEHTKDLVGAMLSSFHNIFYKIIDLGVPAMAKISGKCLGGGMELVLVCNFLFADKSAILGQPEILLGVFAPPASIMLPLKIGYSKAEELLITGRSITAEEGKDMGLINEVYDDKNTMESALDKWIIQHILPKSASSLRYAVKAARSTFNNIIINKLSTLEHLYLDQLMETKDANEGINAFIERRKPVWENC